MARAGRPTAVYQLHVTLARTDPPVWRRLQVAAETTLTRLHHILQIVMGWGDDHEHGFIIDGTEYGPRTRATGPIVIGERGLQLKYEVRTAPAQFTYLYDFGDSWRHTIDVEHISRPARGKRYPLCLAGERACPPEDVGGTPGFADFLRIMGDPGHPRHRELLAWAGGTYDPATFDVAVVNRKLTRLR